MNFLELTNWEKFCANYYNQKNIEHVYRVESYLCKDIRFQLMDDSQRNICRAVAIGHDLLEDTSVTIEELTLFLPSIAIEAIKLLTKEKHVEYKDYINMIMNSTNLFAIIIKQADMLDHLSLKDTLTQRLKDKYYPVLSVLLGLEVCKSEDFKKST